MNAEKLPWAFCCSVRSMGIGSSSILIELASLKKEFRSVGIDLQFGTVLLGWQSSVKPTELLNQFLEGKITRQDFYRSCKNLEVLSLEAQNKVEAFEERAAILEFDAGLLRSVAEAKAKMMIDGLK